jgi:hypothetical protein
MPPVANTRMPTRAATTQVALTVVAAVRRATITAARSEAPALSTPAPG